MTEHLDGVFIPSSYSRITARELGLQERDLPRLLQGTGLAVDILMPGDETRRARLDVPARSGQHRSQAQAVADLDGGIQLLGTNAWATGELSGAEGISQAATFSSRASNGTKRGATRGRRATTRPMTAGGRLSK